MRTSMPKNNVNKDYKSIIDEYVRVLVEKFGRDIISIYIEGSYAKGEANDDSDFDIFIIINNINLNKLNGVGLITSEISQKYGNAKINPQCMGLEEFDSELFDNWSMKSIIALNSVLLYGKDLSNKNVTAKDLEMYYKKSLVEILMGIRHYININKPAEKLSYKNFKAFILKPLSYIMRVERFCNIGKYPLTNKELMESCENKYRIIVEYFINEQKFIDDITKDKNAVLFSIHSLVEKLRRNNALSR